MRVKILAAWAGHDFNYGHGAIVEIPDDIAQARVEAGLVEAVPDATPLRDAFNLDNAEDRYLDLEREHGVLKDHFAAVTSERDAAIAERDALKAQVEELTAPPPKKPAKA